MGRSLICRRNTSFGAIDPSYRLTKRAHGEAELYDVTLERRGFPVVFDGLDVDVSGGLEMVSVQISTEFRVKFWGHVVVSAAEIEADEEAAGEEGDFGRFLFGGEGNEVFPRRAKVFGEEAVLPEDPAGGRGTEGVTAEKPLGMFGEGGDPALRIAVLDWRADEEPLLGQGEGLKDV